MGILFNSFFKITLFKFQQVLKKIQLVIFLCVVLLLVGVTKKWELIFDYRFDLQTAKLVLFFVKNCPSDVQVVFDNEIKRAASSFFDQHMHEKGY